MHQGPALHAIFRISAELRACSMGGGHAHGQHNYDDGNLAAHEVNDDGHVYR